MDVLRGSELGEDGYFFTVFFYVMIKALGAEIRFLFYFIFYFLLNCSLIEFVKSRILN